MQNFAGHLQVCNICGDSESFLRGVLNLNSLPAKRLYPKSLLKLSITFEQLIVCLAVGRVKHNSLNHKSRVLGNKVPHIDFTKVKS